MDQPTAFVMTHESNPNRRRPSTSIIALGITRSLGSHGVRVVRIHPNLLDRSLSSRYCSRTEVCPNFYDSEAELVTFLLTLKQRYPGPRVLIPASDDCASFLARNRGALADHFAIVGPDNSVMEKIIDKQAQYQQAERLGLPIPETYYPGSKQEVATLAQSLTNYPYVIKPLVAHEWRLASMKAVSKGKKGFAVRDAAELIAKYGELSDGDTRVMIQELIGGRDELLFTFITYFNERSEPLAYCIRKKIRQMPIDFGYCTLTVSCTDSVVEEQSIRLLRGVGFHGIAGVEWKRDPKTGKYKLIEINARAMNTIGIAAACGVDIPHIAFQDALRLSPPPVRVWREGVKWINTLQDLWAARDLNKAGELSFRQWRESIRGERVDAVFSLRDIRPFLGYFTAFIGPAVASLTRRRNNRA